MLLLYNANVLTIDSNHPRADAVLIAGDGRFHAVGAREQLSRRTPPGTEMIDLQGRTLIPGFVDAHIHLWKLGLLLTIQLDTRGVKSIPELVDRLRARASARPAGSWIVARGYDERILAERRHPTRAELDSASSDHPILLTHRSGQPRLANSHALKLAQMEDTHPDGMLTSREIYRRHASLQPLTDEDYAAAIHAAAQHLHRHGITSVTDPLVTASQMRVYRQLDEAGELKLRVTGYPIRYADDPRLPHPIPERYVTDWLRIDGMKFIADGNLPAMTAAVLHPYSGQHRQYGRLKHDTSEMFELMWELHQADMRIITHAIGDVGIHQTLMTYEMLNRRQWKPDLHHRIEHMDLADRDLLRRAQQIGVHVVSQPVFLRALSPLFRSHLSPDYVHQCYPFRWMFDAGLVLAFSSDAPFVQDENPLLGMRAAIDRLDGEGVPLAPDQAITAAEALQAYTFNGAIASGDQTNRGSITPGKWADFAVLDGDPLAVPAEALSELRVIATCIAGKLVYGQLTPTQIS
jgi:predicted amidohydrolase YtcJ